MVGLQLTLIPIHMNDREAKVLPNAFKRYMSKEFIAIANINFTTLVSQLLQSLLPHLEDNPLASLLQR